MNTSEAVAFSDAHGEWHCDACAEQERRLKQLKRLKDRDLIPDDVYKDRIRELVAAM